MRQLSIAIFCLFTLPAIKLQAQVTVQNNGIAFIKTSGDIVYINGTLTNASTAALTNNGSLYVLRDLVNNQAAMAVGTGTLYLNGGVSQTLSGTQQFNTYKLSTNNSSGITLNNDLSIYNVHTFVAGIITTSSTPDYLIYQSGSSYTGDDDTKHVDGWVKKFGSTAFTFPVGDANYERTIRTTGLSGPSEFNAKYNTSTPYTTSLLSPLVTIDAAEYWALNKVSGGTASVAMNWDNGKVPFPNWVLPDIRIAGYNGALWTDQGGSATGSVLTTGNITSNSIPAFNLFTFASRSYVVPLTLVSFTATGRDNDVRVEWQTADEFNVSHFTVERSNDGINFYSIGQLPANNNGSGEHYSLDDKSPIKGIAYYRLRSTDIDGKEKLSAVVTVRADHDISQLALVTNPVHDRILLKAGPQLTGIFDYQLTTATGQFLQKGTLAISNGGQSQFALNGNIKAGTYILLVTDHQKNFNFKVIVN